MAFAEKIDSEFFSMEVYLGWAALSEEFGSAPKDRTRLEKCKWRKGELVFEALQKKLNIPPGDPLTVLNAVADYLGKVGYVNAQFHQTSNTEIMYDSVNLVVLPTIRRAREQGLVPKTMMAPEPSTTLFFAALKKLCNMKAEMLPVPDHLRASTPAGSGRELWRLSPLS